MEIKVKMKIKNPAQYLADKGLDKCGAVQRYLDKTMLDSLEPYIPKNTGALIRNGVESTVIGSGVIRYTLPYAKIVYYGRTKKGGDMRFKGAPIRGSYFFRRMKADCMDGILAQVEKMTGGRIIK